MEAEGLKVNIGKTKVMRCKNKVSQVKYTGKFYMELIRKELGLTLSGVLHAAHGYMRNVAILVKTARCI